MILDPLCSHLSIKIKTETHTHCPFHSLCRQKQKVRTINLLSFSFFLSSLNDFLLLYLSCTLLLPHSLLLSSNLNLPPLAHSLSPLLTPPPPPLVLSPPPLHPSDLRGSVTQTDSEGWKGGGERTGMGGFREGDKEVESGGRQRRENGRGM